MRTLRRAKGPTPLARKSRHIPKKAIGVPYARVAPAPPVPLPTVSLVPDIPSIPEYAKALGVTQVDTSHPESYVTRNTLGKRVLHDPANEA